MISFSNKEYFRLYIWRFTSIISGFLSMLVVVPHISEEQELFGVYSVVMSIALYLTYSDLGFLSAGQKYAAESYANGNRDNEYRIIGFTIFLLLVMSVPFTVTAYFVSLNPTVIISELSDNAKIIASRLFFIIAFLLPVQVLLQRLVQSILSIRLKDYLYLRIDFFSNLIKITSTFWFFKSDYLLVEFVAFSILLTILSQIFILINFKTRHSYEILQVLREVKFSLDTYNKVSKLAYSSLLVTLSWILYYELDLVFIGRWLGARQVAIYAVAFSFLNFTRTFWNALYSPFAHRFNHLTGDDNFVFTF